MAKPFHIIFIFLIFLSSCTQKIFIVRHAEKEMENADAMMKSNPPLSAIGKERAVALQKRLEGEKIKFIFSTAYKRTQETAKPLADDNNLSIQNYAAQSDSLQKFVDKIKAIKKGNILIVGHSNTIGNIANAFLEKNEVPDNFSETIYDNLYILQRKKNGYKITVEKYGLSTP